jgi:hypothetical protein
VNFLSPKNAYDSFFVISYIISITGGKGGQGEREDCGWRYGMINGAGGVIDN